MMNRQDTEPSVQAGQDADDRVLPFQLDRTQMRGRVVRLDRTLGTILSQHRYPPVVSGLVAEAALLTALIGQAMKLRWKFSIQVRGEGPVRLIATDYYAPEHAGAPALMRAYAGFDSDAVASSASDPYSLLGQGVFHVTIDQGPDMQPYQGMTPLSGDGLSACAEAYFAQSEQIATRFRIIAAEAQRPGNRPSWRAGGVMLQQLPEDGGIIPDTPRGEDGLMSADDVAAMGAHHEDWNRTNILLDTVEPHELLGPHVGMEDLLLRLFHQETPRIFKDQPIKFGCTCSAERVEAALAQYSARDIAHMTTEDGKVTADCQFCSANYILDPATLGFEAEPGNET